jgi:hypothetical protein
MTLLGRCLPRGELAAGGPEVQGDTAFSMQNGSGQRENSVLTFSRDITVTEDPQKAVSEDEK